MLLTVTGSSSSGTGQFIVVLLIFVGVLALCYFVTKWVAGFQKQKTAGNNIQVLETARIANNRYLQLVKAGSDTYIVIGVGKDEITKLCQLKGDELKEETFVGSQAKPLSASFKDLLEKVRDKDSTEEAHDDKS